MKKKFAAFVLCVICLLSAAGCGQTKTDEQTPPAADQSTTTDDYLTGIGGTYVELFPELSKSEYRNIWIDATAPLVGAENAEVLLIGEAPGETEDLRGEPFVGQAGQLMDRMLAAAGLADQVFMTNSVFWKPPGNRPPSPQEQAACAPFLERAFALMQPKAVLLVGAAAAKSVLNTEDGLMKIRGQWREWSLSDGGASAPVMTTLHPAFLLRQPQAKRVAWADILSLAARLDTAQVEPQA